MTQAMLGWVGLSETLWGTDMLVKHGYYPRFGGSGGPGGTLIGGGHPCQARILPTLWRVWWAGGNPYWRGCILVKHGYYPRHGGSGGPAGTLIGEGSSLSSTDTTPAMGGLVGRREPFWARGILVKHGYYPPLRGFGGPEGTAICGGVPS